MSRGATYYDLEVFECDALEFDQALAGKRAFDRISQLITDIKALKKENFELLDEIRELRKK